MRRISIRKLIWVGSSRKDLDGFPENVKDVMGYALHLAQCGDKHPDSKPLKGFGGAKTLEVVDNFDRNTFRTVYIVKFAEVVYVLHYFQKKSKSGIATPKPDMDLIKSRLKEAENIHQALYG